MKKHLHPFAQVINSFQQAKQEVINAPTTPGGMLNQPNPTASTIHTGATMNNQYHPLKGLLQKQLTDVRNRLAQATAEMQKQQGILENMQMRQNGGLVGNNGAKTLMYNMEKGLDGPLMPGNVGDINRVIWPFWFTSEKVTLGPNQSANANITVTQEAGFVWMSYTKAIFLEEDGGPGQYQLIDPDQANAGGKANELTFIIRDSQSSRSFMNKGLDVNQAGYWKKPTTNITPVLFLPNSNVEVIWQNNSTDRTYRPFITMFGYRLRIDHAKDILSTIQG
jgi:hypothetical protein